MRKKLAIGAVALAAAAVAGCSKPDSGTYGMKIITVLNQVKAQCGSASWPSAI
ncbi:MAG TPA: hypothetical protein VHW06_15690 [Streptosporangiaceae bacterium]|jgi:outer membrane protein assembly factor BamE (lipoprotein component of BamABCDE complex)|nr:hypothetical protein [Streptosporangiaceae bacterium]